MNKPDTCPSCGTSWIAEQIPPNLQHHYSVTHYRRSIGLYDTESDITVAYACPDCGAIFDRWTWMRLKQAPYAQKMH